MRNRIVFAATILILGVSSSAWAQDVTNDAEAASNVSPVERPDIRVSPNLAEVDAPTALTSSEEAESHNILSSESVPVSDAEPSVDIAKDMSLEATVPDIAPETTVVEKAVAEIASPKVKASEKPDNGFALTRERFRFSSYGRAQVGINPQHGSVGRQANITYPSPRIDQPSYSEFTFAYMPYRDENGVEVETVFGLTMGDKFFHFDNDWTSAPVLRNLYAEGRNLFTDGLRLWAGSRIVRGSDIFLLDTWPLDELNIIGAGLGYAAPSRTTVEFSLGVIRLNNDYQYQSVDVVDDRHVGKKNVIFMNRARIVSALKIRQDIPMEALDLSVKGYFEYHQLFEGKKELPDKSTQTLKSDLGWVAGMELSLNRFLNASFFNIFVRGAGGLAAYGSHARPLAVDTEGRATKALNFTFGFGGLIETHDFALHSGLHMAYFKDADGISDDYDDGWEGSWALRPMVFVGDYFRPAIEVSHQFRRPNGVNPASGKQETAQIFKFSLMPAIGFGRGAFKRPELRLIYTLSFLNEAARYTFAEKDQFRDRKIEHYLGVGTEWWF